MIRRILPFLFFNLCLIGITLAQQAILKGKITEQDTGLAVELAAVSVKNVAKGVFSDSNGNYLLKLEPGRDYTIIVSHIAYKEKTYPIRLKPGEEYVLNVTLMRDATLIDELEIQGKRYTDKREEISIIKVDPKIIKQMPSAFNDFNKVLTTLPGVVSNNELSSDYSVRGGNFDENLVYVNGIEIYRPFLVRAGQQEGLSFVNQDLVSNVDFSSGGWQPRFGDKLSSVLNIEYKEPKKFAGSASLGLLGGTLHLEGATPNKRITYVIGARQKSSRYLLNRLPVQGDYFPKFIDLQSYITIDLTNKKDSLVKSNKKTTLGILTSFARNKYSLRPKSQEISFGTINMTKRISVGYYGAESYDFDTWQSGIKLSHWFDNNFKTEIVTSAVRTSERENVDIEGFYRFCDVNTQIGSDNFNQCINPHDIGSYYSYSRNKLTATILNATNRNYYYTDRSTIEVGIGYSFENIKDKLYEYYFIDSADYIPNLTGYLNTGLNLNSNRFNGYIQHTFDLDSLNRLTYGVRLNYWDINNQLLVSPRIQYSLKPRWEKDIVFKAAVGYYSQSPFYRELRDREGQLNLSLKAQNSIHFIAGSDYNFTAWGRPFKFTSELYYKYLTNVIPYDVDNVRIRYFATNSARAYAMGADFRVGGEFISGAESWFSLGILNTKEDIDNDKRGYIRRPTNQTVTASVLFQDHIPNNPSIRMYLNLVLGSGLPFSPPNYPEYRSFKTSPFYRRVDVGFSKLISFNDKDTFIGKSIESVWLGAEVLNLLGANNVISYQWVKDLDNRSYGVPNTLSARYLNLRCIVRF